MGATTTAPTPRTDSFSVSHSLEYFKRSGSAIAAPASALGGPVAVIRVSGRDLVCLEPILGELPLANTFAFRKIKNPKTGHVIDEALVLRFVAPHSFTGEDVVEIQGHGLASLVSELMGVLSEHGVRTALPGEFSFRALQNQKMSLHQAESLHEALSRADLNVGYASSLVGAGDSSESMRTIMNGSLESLSRARGRIEAAIDFPEAAEEQSSDLRSAETFVRNTFAKLSELLTSYSNFVNSGAEPHVVIVGRPNAGKSTLLNIFAGGDRAIVSDVAGTTRDLVEARVRLPSGRWVRVIDTAGFRNLDSISDSEHTPLEAAGMKKGIEAISRANLVIKLSSLKDPHEFSSIYIEKIPTLDLYSHRDVATTSTHDTFAFDLRALAPEEKQKLLLEMDRRLLSEQESNLKHSHNEPLISGRQARLIDECRLEVELALECLAGRRPIELAGDHLRAAEQTLKAAIGENLGDEYIGQIFSQFCLGK